MDGHVYNTQNGVKPRYDNQGSEFGLMHRDLGPGYLMFDVDRMSATVEVSLELRRENEGFVEYRRTDAGISFVALFEIKKHKTDNSIRALDPGETNSLARAEMARRLGARLFVVFATNGKQPFEFYEVDTESGNALSVGTLYYAENNRQCAVNEFWKNQLKIKRFCS